MSIISHLLYDEQQSATYQKEAEGIVCRLSGISISEAEALGKGRIYHMAVTEVLRHLTLYDLYHDPATTPEIHSRRPIRRAIPEERLQDARLAAHEVLSKNGWNGFQEPA